MVAPKIEEIEWGGQGQGRGCGREKTRRKRLLYFRPDLDLDFTVRVNMALCLKYRPCIHYGPSCHGPVQSEKR
jgi:hypothetical protein